MIKKLHKRFGELENDMEEVNQSITKKGYDFYGNPYFIIDDDKYLKWTFNIKNLISLLCVDTEKDMYYKEFENITKEDDINYEKFRKKQSLFKAIKEDFEKGYLTSYKSIVEADVFDNQLEQAKELLESKYKLASAVIAGIVLETALRSLCSNNNIEHGKLDKMNSDLAKANIYNKLQQKRITSLADIRNSAAHGKDSEFTHEDVKKMIDEVGGFLAKYLT